MKKVFRWKYLGLFCVLAIFCSFLFLPKTSTAEDALKVYLPMAGNANDVSGNGNNGTVSGATLTTDKDGNADSAYYFDGVDDSINIGTGMFGITDADGFTISAWINPEDVSGIRNIISRGQYMYPLAFQIKNGILRGGIRTNNTSYLYSNRALTANNWHFVTFTYKNGERKIYIDGILEKSDVPAGAILNSTTYPTIIGRTQNASDYFKGKIDELRIYNRVLSEAEMQGLYTGDIVPQCTQNSDCDDGLFCNGQETCSNNVCQTGTPLVCNDSVSCTSDSCNEESDSCSFISNNDACFPLPYSCTSCSCDSASGCNYFPENCENNVPPVDPPTLSVLLSASPNFGVAPIGDIDLGALVSGTATGSINYTFYCNRSDLGTDLTSPFDAQFNSQSIESINVSDICSYATNGIYTAKVIAERQGIFAEARTTINVSEPIPPADPNQKLNLTDCPVVYQNPRFSLTGKTWPSTYGAADVSLWNDDKVGAASVTIDDGATPDHEWWIEQMNLHNWKMTWFIIVDYVERGNMGYAGTWDVWRRLYNMGHDIGSHTMTHGHCADNCQSENVMDCCSYDTEYRESQRLIKERLGNDAGEVLAYDGSRAYEHNFLEAAKYYTSARWTGGYPNSANATCYMNSKANNISPATIDMILDPNSGFYYRGWTDILIHNVNYPPERTYESVAAGLAYIKSKEADIWFDLHKNIAKYGQERDTNALTVTSVNPSEIKFNLTDQMSDVYFTYPLTIKIRLNNDWNSLSATQNNQAIEAKIIEHEGNKYALVKAVPDKGEVTVTRTEIFVQCIQNSDCDDGLFCNGAETCSNNACHAGTPITCNDSIDCTDDTCNEETDSCSFAPNNNACLPLPYSCASCNCDSISGCHYLPEGCENAIDESLNLYLPFSGNANDVSGNGNNGTVSGATLTTDKDGNADSAYYFDGVDDSISLGTNNFGIYEANEITVSAWINPEDISLIRSIITRGQYIYPFNFQTKNGLLRAGIRTSATSYLSSNQALVANNWYHVAFTFKNGERKIYVNGQLRATNAISGTMSAANQTTAIGKTFNGADYFKGKIDEVKIFNRALTENEILAIQ
ncbi:MAG: polysaccharide deacetylase family protein [Patescibacteria group bacterium]|nr:polysaccharide deacetylase family protein [Patescibacteria group bacterium]